MVRDTFLLFALVYVQFLTFSASLPASTTTNVILPRYGAPTSIPTITSAPIPNLALTTLFCPPINCLNSLTRLEARNGEIWWNEPLPVASTVNSECYASQFIASYTRHFAHALPAFDPLVCQANYVTITSALVEGRTYIACCPRYEILYPT